MKIMEAVERRISVRAQIGRKTADEILTLADERYDFKPEHIGWLQSVAERLRQSGYLTLADVTDDEFDTIIAE